MQVLDQVKISGVFLNRRDTALGDADEYWKQMVLRILSEIHSRYPFEVRVKGGKYEGNEACNKKQVLLNPKQPNKEIFCTAKDQRSISS